MPFSPFKIFNRKHKVVQNSRYLSFLLVKAQVNDNFFLQYLFCGPCGPHVPCWAAAGFFLFSTMMFWPINFPPVGYFVLFWVFFLFKEGDHETKGLTVPPTTSQRP